MVKSSGSFCSWTGIFLVLGVSLLGNSSSRGSSPELGNLTPRGGQRGTEVALVFNGARLADAKEILFYTPGFTVTKLEAVNDTQVKASVKIAPDCRLGEHALRLRTASGITELRTFYVGALPNIEEKEPNSEFTSPQKIPLNVTVNGVVENEDVDYFSFEAKKGQRISAEVEGMRLGTTMFDPYVAILDSKRFELAAQDDSPLFGQDGAVSVIIPADGTYVVQVRESAYGGNGACAYRLHVGTFPRPTGVFPAGGKLGEEIAVHFLGDPLGDMAQKVKLPPGGEPKFGLFAQDAGGISPSPLPFRLSEFGNVLEVEPNHTPEQGTRAEFPVALNGIVSHPGEVDYFRFSAKKGQTFDLTCYARRLGSPLDSVLTIAPIGGGVIAGNDDTNGPDSYLRFTAPEDKDYTVAVTDHLGQGGPNYFYRIECTPVRPLLSLTLPKIGNSAQERQQHQAIVVPKGNRYATLVTATRADFGGELVLGGAGLPPGLGLSSENMPANLDTIPVLFETKPDAPLTGTLANLVGRIADPAQKITGGFRQSVDLISGDPGNSVFWHHDVDRVAVAVGEEVPFKINIVEPKVPLVQNGAMSLRVVAERKAGFKAPINLQMVFNPPGIGSGSATIPEGQNEAALQLNANGGAEIRKWKIVVNGTATVGNGPATVSSQLATLEVAAPFVTLTMERAAVEQGKGTEMYCKVQQLTPFEGPAKIALIGLPNQVTAPEMTITRDTKEFAFKLATTPRSPAGQHKNLFCQLLIQKNGETIFHNVGSGELRIDVPLPPKANEPPKPAVVVAAKPADKPPVPEKRLTRLEKLRLEQEEREKAAKIAGTAPTLSPKK